MAASSPASLSSPHLFTQAHSSTHAHKKKHTHTDTLNTKYTRICPPQGLLLVGARRRFLSKTKTSAAPRPPPALQRAQRTYTQTHLGLHLPPLPPLLHTWVSCALGSRSPASDERREAHTHTFHGSAHTQHHHPALGSAHHHTASPCLALLLLLLLLVLRRPLVFTL